MDQRRATQTVALAAALRSEIEGLVAEEDVVRDTLEGVVDIDGVLDFLLASIGADEAMIDAIAQHVAVLNKRKDRLVRRVDAQKSLLRKALQASGWTGRQRPLGTISLDRKAACLGVLDEVKIPAKFWVQPDPVLDRKALLAALKSSEDVPGASLAPEDTVVRIRRN